MLSRERKAELLARLRQFEGSDALGNGDFSICEEAAELIEAMPEEGCGEAEGWRDIASAPKDGTRILAITGDIADERWANLSHREFVIWHLGKSRRVGLDMGWSLYPGRGVSDEWLAGWRPLPAPPVAASPTGVGEESTEGS